MANLNSSNSMSEDLANLIGAVDQGTGSSRFLIFSSDTAEIVTYHQIETKQIYPKPGWVEQDAMEILKAVLICIEKSCENLIDLEIDSSNVKAIGVTNQRESIVAWNKYTGQPLYNAIIWSDSRTTDIVQQLRHKRGSTVVKEKCGLPISTYFSAVKIRWLIENCTEVKEAIENKSCMIGTIDSWLIWNLTGGLHCGIHVTDVTNASRTMLMNISTLTWDPWLCNFFEIPDFVLPSIRSSAEIFGYVSGGSLHGIPISGCLGDQSAALVGQLCFKPGSAKNTYGTGCFLLFNTGKVPVYSKHGLLTTLAYKLGPNEPPIYALEGSVAVAGALARWLRDNLQIIQDSSYVESLAATVESTHGVYFVPAFSGLYAPHWDSRARGIICGLTAFSTRAHIARAAMEAVCFQTCEIVDAMNQDSGFPLESLQVDGGMTNNFLLMKMQADFLGIPVHLPNMSETSALGVAMAAGAAIGVWDLDVYSSKIIIDTFQPSITPAERYVKYAAWKKAVKRSLEWEDEEQTVQEYYNPFLRSLPGGLFLLSSFAILVLAEIYK